MNWASIAAPVGIGTAFLGGMAGQNKNPQKPAAPPQPITPDPLIQGTTPAPQNPVSPMVQALMGGKATPGGAPLQAPITGSVPLPQPRPPQPSYGAPPVPYTNQTQVMNSLFSPVPSQSPRSDWAGPY